MACARADLILVNVNPAFVADELAFCLNKVGVKVLVMADQLKKMNYVDILRNALKMEAGSDIFRGSRVPSLEHVILFSDIKVKGTTAWKDLLKINSSSYYSEL